MSSSSNHKMGLFGFLILALAVYFVHFTRLQEFGLWEDDYWSIAPNLGKPVDGLGSLLVYYMKTWPTGRPLNHFLPTALAAIGSDLGGLSGIYTLAMIWLGLNAWLVFVLLCRLVPTGAALTGAFAYLLFPADTTKILLIHAAHIQGAMTFLLFGTLLWLKGGIWRWIGYAVAVLSLLAYETAFLPFLAAPLLLIGDRRSTLRTWGGHILLCTAAIGTVAFIRFKTGDVRAAAAVGSISETIHRMLTSLYLGPETSMQAFLVGTKTGFLQLSTMSVFRGLILAAIICYIWMQYPARAAEPTGNMEGKFWPHWLNQPRFPDEKLPWWWLAVVGLIMWSGSYALSIVNYPPTQLVGRFTSTHVAAAWPAAIVIAALSSAAFRFGPRLRASFSVSLLILMILLTSYHNFIQSEYIRAWRLQQSFWTEVLTLAPEADSGWTIIVTGPPRKQPAVIAANSWADYHACRLIFDGQHTGTETAFAHLGYLGSNIIFREANGVFTWNPRFWSNEYVAIDQTRLVLFESDGTALHRIHEISTNAGKLICIAPPSPPPRTIWPSTPLARLFFPDRYP